jgi:hypothetical protein
MNGVIVRAIVGGSRHGARHIQCADIEHRGGEQ